MPYCPFRHFPQLGIATKLGFVRLACLIHAANVRSEPESNPSKNLAFLKFPHLAAGGFEAPAEQLFKVNGKPLNVSSSRVVNKLSQKSLRSPCDTTQMTHLQ